MDYMTLKEASEKWGVTYSWRCKDGNGLADTQISTKT